MTPATTAAIAAATEPPPATTATTATTAAPEEPPEGPCWTEFGGDPQRTPRPARPALGKPRAKPVWARRMGSYMEYPPSFCDGTLYVNTFDGLTVALDAATGEEPGPGSAA